MISTYGWISASHSLNEEVLRCFLQRAFLRSAMSGRTGISCSPVSPSRTWSSPRKTWTNGAAPGAADERTQAIWQTAFPLDPIAFTRGRNRLCGYGPRRGHATSSSPIWRTARKTPSPSSRPTPNNPQAPTVIPPELIDNNSVFPCGHSTCISGLVAPATPAVTPASPFVNVAGPQVFRGSTRDGPPGSKPTQVACIPVRRRSRHKNQHHRASQRHADSIGWGLSTNRVGLCRTNRRRSKGVDPGTRFETQAITNARLPFPTRDGLFSLEWAVVFFCRHSPCYNAAPARSTRSIFAIYAQG